MDTLFIPVILGTARSGRTTSHIAHYVLDQARAYGFESELIDVSEFVTRPVTGSALSEEKAGEWSGIMKRAHGLIIVAPEYNRGYPGELKLLLDELYDEYAQKPLGICGSGDRIGGVHLVEALRSVAIEFRMLPLHSAVYFSDAKKLFTEKGALTDPKYKERVVEMLSELALYATALKQVQ